jgi:hypothetical protein
MMIFMENIEPPPPLVQVPDDEIISKMAERLAQEDRWVKNLIDGLAGILRN